MRLAYPDVTDQLGMLIVDSTMERGGIVIRNLQFYPCRSSGGIPVPDSNPSPVPLFSSQGGASSSTDSAAPPECGLDPTPELKHFLHVTLEMTDDPKHPIRKFASWGTYVDAKLRELQEQFGHNPSTSHDELLEALHSKNPKFGPNNKDEFLATVPLQKIRDLTGCQLAPQSATFVAELTDNTLHQPPDLQWHLSGRAAKSKTTGTCSAAFEPFDGHLTLFLD